MQLACEQKLYKVVSLPAGVILKMVPPPLAPYTVAPYKLPSVAWISPARPDRPFHPEAVQRRQPALKSDFEDGAIVRSPAILGRPVKVPIDGLNQRCGKYFGAARRSCFWEQKL